jgi:hypothetical protein
MRPDANRPAIRLVIGLTHLFGDRWRMNPRSQRLYDLAQLKALPTNKKPAHEQHKDKGHLCRDDGFRKPRN